MILNRDEREEIILTWTLDMIERKVASFDNRSQKLFKSSEEIFFRDLLEVFKSEVYVRHYLEIGEYDIENFEYLSVRSLNIMHFNQLIEHGKITSWWSDIDL